MQKKAYSYIRFSTPEQIKGDSLRRQLEASKTEFATRLAGLDREARMRFPGWNDWDSAGRPLPDTPDAKRDMPC